MVLQRHEFMHAYELSTHLLTSSARHWPCQSSSVPPSAAVSGMDRTSSILRLAIKVSVPYSPQGASSKLTGSISGFIFSQVAHASLLSINHLREGHSPIRRCLLLR
jgi:hypothetical protein